MKVGSRIEEKNNPVSLVWRERNLPGFKHKSRIRRFGSDLCIRTRSNGRIDIPLTNLARLKCSIMFVQPGAFYSEAEEWAFCTSYSNLSG
jgi:hypothetical protein